MKQNNPPVVELSMRYMTEKDLEMVMGWCKEEKWNIGKYDASFYHKLDPKGHFLLLENGQPVGAISIIRYSSQLFTIGPFIVKKEYRNKGYGAEIWQYAMRVLEKNPDATAYLHAVPPQIPRYARSGFKESFHIQRWQKTSTENSVANKDAINEGIKNLNTVSSESIIEYDQSIFSVSRKKLLTEFMQCQHVAGFASTDDSGKVTGLGIIRPCIEGFRVGPLYADHIENAQKLFRVLLGAVNNSTVFLDAPSHNPYIESFTQHFNLNRVPEADTVAMFKGDVPPSLLENKHKNYAICSLEIG
ncbi:GCN5-related N-acetyltransferase [Candidatus Rickettsiella viridis]|uniref:GCN5-related N-acetyltransferase n=1 Tax=Candidatus Rickettsiella viridis TaxID=676208 RepID=A0A2Z5V732_9COXI|nr:GCN5-related N-acetyltransferase [Candidatus Rickettsiella viridis]